MANFLNEIIESSIQPVKTNVLWIKNGVPYYYNKRWKPLLGGASGGTVDSPITFGEGEYSAILQYSNNKTLGDRSIALGYGLTSNNNYEASFGKYNKSIRSDDTSKATLFSIGNGTSSFLKNVFEVKQNGDIYIEGLDKSIQDYLRSIEEYDELLEDLSNRITITDSKLETKFEEFEEGINGELEEYYSKLTQTAKEIRAEVGSITTELDGRITENTALISITAKEIRSEVSEITTDLDGRIETNKSSISQTAEEIRAEVSRVQTDLSGRIDTANSTISQTADAIRLEVEAVEGELNGKIERNTSLINQTAESIGLEVTNLSDHLNDVNSELAGLIAENKAAIEINANEIKNKVSSDTFNAFSGEVQNQFTEVSTTVEGVKTSVQNIDGKLTEVNATVDGVTTRLGTAEADIESLKKQSDGSIDTHFGTEAPTLNNEPAVNWVTDGLKNEHTGDIYYNNNTGEAYRFTYNPETNEYFWIELTDSALTDALDKISKLESAVDGKVTIFYTTPTNYKYGDMWFVHEDNASFKKGTLVSATNLDKGTIRATLVLADWKEEIEYVNFDELTEELTSLNDYIDNAFKDGVLSEAEIKHIQELKKNFQLSYKEINDLNSFLIITAFATEENKTALSNAKKALDTAFNELIDAIDNLNTELDDEGNNPSLALYNQKYQAYLKALDNYTEIAVLIQSEAEQELLKPSDYIKQISSDGYLTSIEKKQLIAVWKQIAEEFTANRGIAFNYKILKKEGNNYIDRTDIYDVDTGYHAIYNNYKNSYEAIASIFTDEADPFGFKDLQNTTILSETTIESLASIEQLFDTYYANLALFSEMISKISNDITDAHQKVIDVTNALVDQLDPREAITQIGTGVVLSSVLGVKDIDGNLEAVLNGSDSIEEAQSTKHGNHGKIVFAGGINGSSKWDNATTIIYEDGHVVINSGEISDFVSIGNATFKNVVEAVTQFDVISSPHVNPNTGEIEYIPLFQVNRNDAGEIIYVSSVYDFVGNREISALGFNAGGGSSGGGLISKVYNVSNFGNITDTTNTATFNAYAIDSLYKRIVLLENKEVDLTGYATESWVAGQGFITSTALSPYMKTADANDTFATKTALNNLSSSHDSLAKRVSTAEGNISTNAKAISANTTAINTNAAAITNLGKRVTANEGNIAKILKWFAVDSNGNLYTTYNFYSTKEISANGLSIGSGSSGGGLISQVYGTTAFGTIASESNSATFNAYAIDSLYKRIVSLEGKATAVSFVPALTSGKQIGTLSIDGVSTVLYGVDAYSKADADSTFLKLSGGKVTGVVRIDTANSDIFFGIRQSGSDKSAFGWSTTDGTYMYSYKSSRVLGIKDDGTPFFGTTSAHYTLYHSGNFNPANYLPVNGGAIGAGNSNSFPLTISSTSAYTGIAFTTSGGTAYFRYQGGSNWGVTDNGWNNSYTLLHSGNYNSYALPLSGGTLTKVDGNPLIIKRTGSGGPGVEFYAGDTRLGSLGIGTDFVPFFYNANKVNLYTIIHSGNIGDYALKTDGSNTMGAGAYLKWATAEGQEDYSVYNSGFRLLGYNVSTDNYMGGIHVGNRYGWQLVRDGVDNALKVRYRKIDTSTWLSWKTIAFTDSNVASATKLATARTIWGQSFDGSGNVTGALKTPSGYNAVTILDSYLVLGQGMAENSLPTYLDGYNVYMRYGKSSTIGFTLNSSGNTTIGSTGDLAGTTYKLYINGSANIANALTVATNVQIPINGDRITFCSATGTYTKGILAMNTSNTYLEAPLATDSASGAKPAIMIGWRGCSAATGTTKPYPITITSGEIALNGTTAINGTLKNVNNIYPNSAGERYIGTSTNPFKYMYAEWYGAGTGQTLSFGANNATHIWVDTSGRVGIGTTSPQHKLEVTGDIASSGSLRMGLNSAYGAYLQTNEEGWTGIYSANKGSWQATNMYLMPDGDVKFAHAARVIGKNTNGDTGLFVEGTQYSMWFGVGSGNVNRGIFDINNNGWWIYRGSDTLTRISGGIETSTGSFTGAVTMYSTLAVAGISTFEQEVRHKIGIRPNADNTRYVGTSSYRFNEGYINNMYTNAMYVGKGTTYGFKSDGSINATAITANSGVKVASGQALTFLDASGKEHKLTYDSTAGAFKFDGNILVLGDGQFNAIN